MVQVPELDVSVAGSDKVRAVIREGDGCDLTRHLIGCKEDVFLKKHTEGEMNATEKTTDYFS